MRDPLRRRHGSRAARIGRNHHAISDRVGGRGGHSGRRPPRRNLGGRAVPPGGRRPRRGSRSRDRTPPRARRRTRRDRSRPDRALARVEGALRAAPRARAHPLGTAAAPRLRHRAPPPSGRCARRHAHRADRGEPERRERQRERQRPRARSRSPRTTTSRTTSSSSPPTPTTTSFRSHCPSTRIRARSAGIASATRQPRGRRSPHRASSRRPAPKAC